MKFWTIALSVSVATNLALLGILVSREGTAPRTANAPNPTAPLPESRAAADGTGKSPLERAVLAGDLQALANAGCPPELIKALTVGRAFAKLQERTRSLRPDSSNDAQYWRRMSGIDYTKLSPQERHEFSSARTEFFDTLQETLGANIGEIFSGRNPRYSFLPPDKQSLLRRIDQDYTDLRNRLESEQAIVELPSDREKMRLLSKEREKDIAAALTPEEREQYELRTSSSAEAIRNRYADALLTEEQYKQAVALQKSYDDRYRTDDVPFGTRPSPETIAAREEDQRKLQEAIQSLIGPEQWAAASRAKDWELRTLDSLAERLNLPPTAKDAALALRESYAKQSMVVAANASLSTDERKTQLRALATKARSDLQSVLGPEGGPALAQDARWMGLLRDGQAFSTNPADSPKGNPSLGQSVFPVRPKSAEPPH